MCTKIPFLGVFKNKNRTYEFQGDIVCPSSTGEFRSRHHYTVEDNNSHVLKTVELFDAIEVMKRNEIQIFFLDVTSEQQYCSDNLWDVNELPKQSVGARVSSEVRFSFNEKGRFCTKSSSFWALQDTTNPKS